MEVQTYKWDRASCPHEGRGFLTGGPAIIFSVPDLDAQESVCPSGFERLPRISSGRMCKHSQSPSGANGAQHFACGQPLPQKRNRSPNENVHTIGGIAVFNSRQNQNLGGTHSSTHFAILIQTRRCKPTVMLRHHQDATAAAAEFCAQILKRPTPAVRPIGVHVRDSEKFHRLLASRLEQVVVNGVIAIGEEYFRIIASPIVISVSAVKA